MILGNESGADDAAGEIDRVVEENLAVYRASMHRLREDVNQENQVAFDYRGRLVYELLQNADDALSGQATKDDRALFRLTDDALWVANTGRSLTAADVRGLCGLGASSKTGASDRRRAAIGHKGLGFKSVLEISSAPEVYSTTVCLQLGREHARHLVSALWDELGRGPVSDVPAMRFPVSVEPSDEWSRLREEGYNTVFRFGFHDSVTADDRAELTRQMLTLPATSILFLKHLEEVRIQVETTELSEERLWLLERFQLAPSNGGSSQSVVEEKVPGLQTSGLYRVELMEGESSWSYLVAHDAEVSIGAYRGGLVGPAWEGVEYSEVSAALPNPATTPGRWAAQHFHVFLPTEEPTGMPLLVNGAFTTDLSRQHVRVADDPADYNGHLLRSSAAVFARVLVPHLTEVHGAKFVLEGLERLGDETSRTGELLRNHLAEALSDVPLLPVGDGSLARLSQAVVPAPALGEVGAELAQLLRTGAEWEGRRFPVPELCEGRLAAVAVELGARGLGAADTLAALADGLDPVRARFRPEAGDRFAVDPVLEMCVTLWERCGVGQRAELKAVAPQLPVFPTGQGPDGTVRREVLGTRKPFLPPQASTGALPLHRLCFLAHEVCWGKLGKSDQQSLLGARIGAWTALFDLREFAFQAVMAAAVLPALSRARSSPDAELLELNRDIEVVAAIGRLAAATMKPHEPLRLARLTELGLFPLSRLELPCRAEDGGERWLPAYRIYLGRDWIGEESVETLVETAAAAGERLDIAFLAPPERFYAADPIFLGGSHSQDGTPPAAAEGGEIEEADLETDVESAAEGSARDRWIDFLTWLGVNHCLRLVPFQDVDDRQAGWTNTKNLARPSGNAFRHLGETWAEYAETLRRAVSGPGAEAKHIYAYQVHDLDHIDAVSRSANDPQSNVGRRLLEHLGSHWPRYLPHLRAELALVPYGRSPSQRNQPIRAQSDELTSAGTNLWLYRLRQLPICPTSHGPREPAQAWRPSSEVERRLGRGRRASGDYLPVLDFGTEGMPEGLSGLLDAIGVRPDLVPAAFTVHDASLLCRQLQHLHEQRPIDEAVLRGEIRPTYLAMFELLSGKRPDENPPLAQAPLAALTERGYQFLPAEEVVYASVSGSRERSGVAGKIPLFIIDAEPSAQAPLRSLFGCRLLEDVLDWHPDPGEPALDGDELAHFRAGLAELAPWMLARLAAERPAREIEDRRRVRDIVASAEPVDDLSMTCSYRGERIVSSRDRRHYVRRTPGRPLQCFVRWDGQAWPPVAEDAATLAITFADALQVNMVEAFLGLIQAPNDSARRQLLVLAGASGRLVELYDSLDEVDQAGEPEPLTPTASPNHEAPGDAVIEEADDTGASVPDVGSGDSGSGAGRQPAAAPRVPLWRFEDLLIDGEPVVITGGPDGSGDAGGARHDDSPEEDAPGTGSSPGGATSGGDQGPPRAAPGTDLEELDRLGMQVTMAWEQHRLKGEAGVEVVDVHSPATIREAEALSPAVAAAFDQLERDGVSRLWPGFDVLVLVNGEIDRMIELKSSTTDARVAAMSWNEWKSARGSWRDRFWLYVAGNLRSDLDGAKPFLRCIHDPFGSLEATKTEATQRRRVMQLRVREFAAADHVDLGVVTQRHG